MPNDACEKGRSAFLFLPDLLSGLATYLEMIATHELLPRANFLTAAALSINSTSPFMAMTKQTMVFGQPFSTDPKTWARRECSERKVPMKVLVLGLHRTGTSCAPPPFCQSNE